jgi:hypothetical protein
LWQQTKDFATSHSSTHEVQEQGAWVWLDTETGEYTVDSSNGVETHTVALVPGVNQAYVTMWMPNDIMTDISDPTIPGKFVVVSFHTHYPICYALVEQGSWLEHPCGPTIFNDYNVVDSNRIPGFVYDYTASSITNNHKINDPAHIYPYGSHIKREVRKY